MSLDRLLHAPPELRLAVREGWPVESSLIRDGAAGLDGARVRDAGTSSRAAVLATHPAAPYVPLACALAVAFATGSTVAVWLAFAAIVGYSLSGST